MRSTCCRLRDRLRLRRLYGLLSWLCDLVWLLLHEWWRLIHRARRWIMHDWGRMMRLARRWVMHRLHNRSGRLRLCLHRLLGVVNRRLNTGAGVLIWMRLERAWLWWRGCWRLSAMNRRRLWLLVMWWCSGRSWGRLLCIDMACSLLAAGWIANRRRHRRVC